MAGCVRVTAPATSANLGPGFDALAVALTMTDSVRMEVADAGVDVEVDGVGADELPRDHSHLVVRSMVAAFAVMGVRPPGLRLSCHNAIPQGRGLGSSAAAIVAGILGARALVDGGAERLDDRAVLALASDLDGHRDNVAACLLGGLTVAWSTEGGVAAVRVDVREQAVLFVPPHPLATTTARRVLPDAVPHPEATRTAGRAALLLAALTQSGTERPTLLAATEDWLHQPYRAGLMPESFGLLHRLRARGLPAVLSGAGPSVLVLGDHGLGDDRGSDAAMWGVPDWQLRRVAINPLGAYLQRASRNGQPGMNDVRQRL